MYLLKQLIKRKPKMITQSDFTSVNNNSFGNPRYVIHFLNIPTDETNISKMYNEALNKCKPLGGKKFHNKQYGGGIVFCTYDLNALIIKLNNLK